MGRTADGDTLGYRFLDVQQLQELLGKDIAQHTRNDDNYHRHSHMSTQLLRHADTYRRSDALRQEGNVRGMIEMEKQGKQQYGAQASQDSRHDACHHSPIVLLEQFYLLIQRNSQTDGGWSKQIADHIGTGRIGFVVYTRKEQHADYQHDSDEKGIHQRPPRLHLQQHTDAV